MADIARLGPPSKKASSAPGASAASGSPQSVAGSRSAGAGAAGPGPSGRHAAARAGAKELLARQQFFKRIFSPEVLTEPLPPALRLSLTRNFAFFTRIFTQFFDPNQQREVRQAIPGLSKRQ